MNLATDIWAKVLELMQPDMTTTTIHTWFDDATAVALEEDRFVLYSPTRFKHLSAARKEQLSPRHGGVYLRAVRGGLVQQVCPRRRPGGG